MAKRVYRPRNKFINDIKTNTLEMSGESMLKVPAIRKDIQFQKMPGLGAVNIGREGWTVAMLKK